MFTNQHNYIIRETKCSHVKGWQFYENMIINIEYKSINQYYFSNMKMLTLQSFTDIGRNRPDNVRKFMSYDEVAKICRQFQHFYGVHSIPHITTRGKH